MGATSARRLAGLGYDVRVWNRSQDKAEALAQTTPSITVAATARDAVEAGCTNDELHEFKSYFPRDASPTALDLLQKMLVFDPHERASVERCLEHPYLSDLHGQMPEPLCDDAFDFEFERSDAAETKSGDALPREELQSMMFEEMVQLQLVMEDGSQAKEEDSAAPEAK